MLLGSILTSSFYIQPSSFPSTTYERDCLFSTVYSCLLCRSLGDYRCVGFSLGFLNFSLKKLKIELPDPAVLLLSVYLEKTIIQKDACNPNVHFSIITIARTQKQPKCPSTKEWIKMWYIYTMEYCSAIKRNEIVSFVETLMDLETVTQSESEKEKQIFYNIACM